MKLNYKLQRVCGTYYSNNTGTNTTKPNILYISKPNSSTEDDIILSPSYNRIQCYTIRDNIIKTLNIESRSNIDIISYSNSKEYGELMMVVDIEGYYQVIRIQSNNSNVLEESSGSISSMVIGKGRFKGGKVRSIEWFDDKVAICIDKFVEIWKVCPLEDTILVFIKKLCGFSDVVVSAKWDKNGRYIVAASRDCTARVFQWKKKGNKVDEISMLLRGHKAGLVDIFWYHDTNSITTTMEENNINSKDNELLVSVALDGGIFLWRKLVKKKKNAPWRYQYEKHFAFQSNATVTCCSFHKPSGLLSLGYSNGIFALYEVPSMASIHTLSLSKQSVCAMSFSPNGGAIAMGVACPTSQSLLVWEWSSETFLIKQSSHGHSLTTFAFSPQGSIIATGGEDGKVKLWKTYHGLCYATLPSNHTAPVKALVFTTNEKVVLSASLDGTVKAHDLLRYRHFRTFVTPTPCQILSLATNASSTIVAAGAFSEPYHIFLWNMANAQLLEVLAAHSGPVTSLHFSNSTTNNSLLLSTSWDQTTQVWDYTNSSKINNDTFNMNKDIIASSISPDQDHIALATIDAMITIWNITDAKIKYEIYGSKDIQSAKKYNDRYKSMNNVKSSTYFTSICYSSDGSCIIVSGNSNYVCLYEVTQQILLKKFMITHNRSLDGVYDYYTSKEEELFFDHVADNEIDNNRRLPGANRLDDGNRTSLPEVYSTQVGFSSTSYEFAVISTEGLHVYSLQDDLLFDPILLSMDVTSTKVIQYVEKKEYGLALRYALQLNERPLLIQVLDSIPYKSIPNIISSNTILQPKFYSLYLQTLSSIFQNTSHVDYYLQYIFQFLIHHGQYLQKKGTNNNKIQKELRLIYKVLSRRCQDEDWKYIWGENDYWLMFMDEIGEQKVSDASAMNKDNLNGMDVDVSAA